MEESSIDHAAIKLKEISDWFSEYEKTVSSESDSRIKLIDRILIDVLSWTEESIQTEERTGKGFLDYKLSINDKNRIVVEAKKTKVNFEIPEHRSGQAFKINGPTINKNAEIAINQVAPYCVLKGAEVAVCTNGNQWIIFRANRLADGKDITEGKAFLFSCIESILTNFALFYDLLAYENVKDFRYRGLFNDAEGLKVRHFSFAKCLRPPNSKHLLDRDEFSMDFDSIMSSFFQRLRGEEDEEMIQKCFVVTSESTRAETRISRIADDLVTRVRELDTNTSRLLSDVVEQVQKNQKNRFVVLIGNKGCGKSTFVDRFFSNILEKNIRSGIVLIRVDLGLSSGDPKTIHSWLDEALLAAAEDAVYGQEGPNWEETIGAMFWKEYKRWKNVTKKELYKKDKQKFEISFGEFVEKTREEKTNDYVRRLLHNVVQSRKKIPCLIFDNTDHHSIAFQESVFQYARSIYESILTMMIMPMTDKTSWQLSKEGVLQSFENEVFHLPTPEPFRVLERRINYLSQKVQEAKDKHNGEYFIGRNIRLDINNIDKFAHTLNEVFVSSGETSKWFGSLVNYDVRRLLELIRESVSSPHLTIDNLYSAHVSGNADTIAPWKVKKAIICQKYDIYPATQHSYVQNIYELDADLFTSPLLPARILQFLRDSRSIENQKNGGWVEIERIFDFFVGMGFEARDVKEVLNQLLQTGLMLNYDPTVLNLEKVSKVEISSSGKLHLLWGTTDEDYMKHMGTVTNIRDQKYFNAIKTASTNMRENWPDFIINFAQYLLFEDNEWCTTPNHRSYKGQTNLTKRVRRVVSDAENFKGNKSHNFSRFNRRFTKERN